MRLRARLQKLERSVALDSGCPACRHRRGLTVSVFSEQLDDGTITEPQGMPAACECCGEIPEQIRHFIECEVVVHTYADVFGNGDDVETSVLEE